MGDIPRCDNGRVPSPGPSVLGRGVVVRAGSPPPPPWAGAPVVTIDEATLDDPSDTVTNLHAAWSARRPVVVALAVDPARFREPQTWDAPPWALDAGFEPWFDRLHFLVWANNYDARAGEPVWWWARKAERAGATVTDDGATDVELGSGAPACGCR